MKTAFTDTQGAADVGGSDWAELREAGWQKRFSALLLAAGKTAQDAARDTKSAAWKVKIARELRTTSTATNAWIAERLAMGHPSRVCTLIRKKI